LFNNWLKQLPLLPIDTPKATILQGTAFEITPSPTATASTPSATGPVFGHLPFTSLVPANAQFYRWEAWPASRRVNRQTNVIAAETFGAPSSEVPFVPSGFAAVGRFALPGLPPACFRWELTPPVGHPFNCGASVPLFGQAGGGVEVEFATSFRSVVAVPAPTFLSPL
jgi:hypothetical protein